MARHAARGRHVPGFLTGIEPPSIAELDQAVQEHWDIKTQRVNLTNQEEECSQRLGKLLEKHKLFVYETEDGDGKLIEGFRPGAPGTDVKGKTRKKKTPKAPRAAGTKAKKGGHPDDNE